MWSQVKEIRFYKPGVELKVSWGTGVPAVDPQPVSHSALLLHFPSDQCKADRRFWKVFLFPPEMWLLPQVYITHKFSLLSLVWEVYLWVKSSPGRPQIQVLILSLLCSWPRLYAHYQETCLVSVGHIWGQISKEEAAHSFTFFSH